MVRRVVEARRMSSFYAKVRGTRACEMPNVRADCARMEFAKKSPVAARAALEARGEVDRTEAAVPAVAVEVAMRAATQEARLEMVAMGMEAVGMGVGMGMGMGMAAGPLDPAEARR